MRIDEALESIRAAAEQLAADHPDLLADDQAWIDTLAGLTDGLDLAEHLAERCLHLIALQLHAAERSRAMAARAQRLAKAEENLRGVILALVDAAGGKKVVRPTLTLSPRTKAARLAATDPDATPPEYTKAGPRIPDRDRIREALELGGEVAGWTIEPERRSLAILTK